MEESLMKKHVTLVAAFQIGFSAMGLIAATVIFLVFAFAGTFVDDIDVAGNVIKFIGTVLPGFIMLGSVLGLIGGIGLLSFQKWARILVMIISAIGCFIFPIGTIIGIYSLWVLMQDDTTVLFR